MAKVRVVHVHETPMVHKTRDFEEATSVLSVGLAYEVLLAGMLAVALASVESPFPNARTERLPRKTFRLAAYRAVLGTRP
jgi:hypothetical protein